MAKGSGNSARPLGGGNSLHLDGEELARLWNDGKSYTEIGKIVGAASQTVKNNLIRNGTIPKPCKKIRFPESQEEIAKLRKMFDGELKTVELAEKLGVGISTVSSWRRRLGIKNTGRGRRRKWVKRTGAFLMFVIGALLGVRSGIHRRTFSNGGGRIYRVCGDRAGGL